MWKCKAFVAFFVALLFFPAIAWANPKPSFDCAKASSFAEKAICSNDDLAQLDVRMSKAYKAQLAATSNITSAKADQRAWVKKREACGSVECIRSLYAARIPELGGGIVVAAANNAAEPAGTFVVANTLPPDDYLSLRTEPSTKIGSRITKMANGTELKVLDRRSDGWWRVEIVATGQSGWASSGSSKKYIVWKPSTKTASTTSTTNAKAASDAKAEADARAARNAKAIADAKAAKAAAKIAADEKAAKLAADKAREAAEKDQAISLISVALGNPDPADLFVFLNQGGNAPNLAKNLDGELVSASGMVSVCHTKIAPPYMGERGERYTQLATDLLKISLPKQSEPSSVALDHCGSQNPTDVVYFQLNQLSDAPIAFLRYVNEALPNSLVKVGSFTRSDADNAEIEYQQKLIDQEQAEKDAVSAILAGIKVGESENFSFLIADSNDGALCFTLEGVLSSYGATEDQVRNMLNAIIDASSPKWTAALNRTILARKSIDLIYLSMNKSKPDCGWIFSNDNSLSKVAVAMDRDGIQYSTIPVTLTLNELDKAMDQERVAEAEKQAAKLAAEAANRKAAADAEAAAAAAEASRKAQMPPYRAYVTCLLNGNVNNPIQASACMMGSSNSPGGSASITTYGQQTNFTPSMMMQTFNRSVTEIELSEDFEIILQSNSEDYYVLNLEIRDRDDQVVFQGQASQYKSIKVANNAESDQAGVINSSKTIESSASVLTPDVDCYDRQASVARLGLSIDISEMGYQFCFGYIDYLSFLNKMPIGIDPNNSEFSVKAQSFANLDAACYSDVLDARAGAQGVVDVVDAKDFNGLKDKLNFCTNMLEAGGL